MLWKEGKPLQSDVLIGTACFFISVFIKSLSSAMWADDEYLTNTIVYFKKIYFFKMQNGHTNLDTARTVMLWRMIKEMYACTKIHNTQYEEDL